MMGFIIAPSAALYNAPDHNSGLETECLFGEEITIHDQDDANQDGANQDGPHKDSNWLDATLKTDGYRGWLNAESIIGTMPQPTHRVITPRALLTSGEDIKTPACHAPAWLPMAAQVNATPISNKEGERLMAVKGPDGIIGYLPECHLLPLDQRVEDWVGVAESLIGTPYRWGGRDSIGIDCSALVQLAMAAGGYQVMRNSGSQEKTIGTTLAGLDDLRRGDLVFWPGHVGIMTDNKTLLHSNMFHAMTATEPLNQTCARLEKQGLAVSRLCRP